MFSIKDSFYSFTGKSPQIIQYAIRVFGSTDLSEDQWRQCEDQIKVFYYLDVICLFQGKESYVLSAIKHVAFS